ncbi:hypothetical protein GGR57DRAFT_253796 [Xylariaceae sp. FL1272]|nr:hypothetical protein GGR57DRAFT_253796 [Xylariaceae sp. FL1272]
MKWAAALCALAVSSTLAAPLSTVVDKMPTRVGTVNAAQQPVGFVNIDLQPTSNEKSKTPKKQSQPQHSAANPKTKKKGASGKSKSLLNSISRQWLPKNPFVKDSAIIMEETKAINEEWEPEPEASIVELETKASRDSWVWIPCVSSGKKLHYKRVRIYADMLVVGLVLSFVAVLLVIELWTPVIQRIRRLRSGHGAIYLDEEAFKLNDMKKPCNACASHISELPEEGQQERNTEKGRVSVP